MSKYEKLKEQIARYKIQHKENQLFEFLLSFNNFDSLEIFETLLQVYFDEYKIREHYAARILEKIKIAEQKLNKEELRNFLYHFLKNIDSNIDCYNFFYLINQDFKKGNTEFILTKNDIQEICYHRLETYTVCCNQIEVAFKLLYSCWDKVDDNNQVLILNEALNSMRSYIEKDSIVTEKYLKFLPRPKYFPPTSMENSSIYDFVFEPYTERIFSGWENFNEFINNLNTKDIDQQAVNNIRKLFKIYAENQYQVIPIPKNELNNFGITIDRFKY